MIQTILLAVCPHVMGSEFLLGYFHTAPPPSVVHPQVIGIGSLVGAVVGTSIGLTLLYAVIVLVTWILWNKRYN